MLGIEGLVGTVNVLSVRNEAEAAQRFLEGVIDTKLFLDLAWVVGKPARAKFFYDRGNAFFWTNARCTFDVLEEVAEGYRAKGYTFEYADRRGETLITVYKN